MIGTLLNAAAVLAGGCASLLGARDFSPANQSRIKIAVAVFLIYTGFSAVWKGLNGSFGQILEQLAIVLLALILGNLLGKLLRLQKSLNHLGKYARDRFANARPSDPNKFNDGFITCSILYCATPLALLGALQEGLAQDFKGLAIKAVMDGLATLAFARVFGWGVMLSVVPLLAFQGTISLIAQGMAPWLEQHGLVDALLATNGFLVTFLTLIVLDLKKVQIADYLPSLAVAPLLTWLLS